MWERRTNLIQLTESGSLTNDISAAIEKVRKNGTIFSALEPHSLVDHAERAQKRRSSDCLNRWRTHLSKKTTWPYRHRPASCPT